VFDMVHGATMRFIICLDLRRLD